MALTPKEIAEVVKLTERRARLEAQIKSDVEDAAKLKGKEYDEFKKYIAAKRDELKLLNQQSKVANDIKDETEDLIKASDKQRSLTYDIEKAEEKINQRKEAAKELIKNKNKFTKEEFKTLTAINAKELKKLKLNTDMAKVNQKNDEITQKLLGSLGMAGTSLSTMKQQAVLFGRALLSSPTTMLLAAFAVLVGYTVDIVKNSIKLSQELGVSIGQAAKLNKEIGFVRRKFLELVGVDTTKIAGELVEEFGSLNKLTGKQIEDIGTFALGLGASTQSVIKLDKTFQSVLPSVQDSATSMGMLEKFAGMAKAEGVATGAVINDLAENTELFAEFGKDGGQNLARAAIQARKLGLSLQTTAKIANSLLDFESSIEKEMEASLMIGKQLNFNRARQLALEGDLAGAAQDVVAQIGGQAELSRMNVLQRRALADSIGVSVDELSRLASGSLEVKSDDAEPIDAMAEGLSFLNETGKQLTNAIIGLGIGVSALTAATLARSGALGKLASMASATSITKGGTLNKTGGVGKKLAGTRTGKVLDAANKTIMKTGSKTIGTRATQLAVGGGKGALRRVPGVSAVLGGMDIASGIQEGDKGQVGGGVGAIVGGAIGTLGGPLGMAVGTMAGQFIGEKIGSFFENRETIEQKEKEYKDQLGKLEKEKADLTAEQQAELQMAMLGGTAGMENFIAKYDSMNPFSDTNQVAELLKVLIKKQDDIVNATDNLTRD